MENVSSILADSAEKVDTREGVAEKDRPPRSTEQWAIDERIAQNTPCDFAGCDGGLHDADLPAQEWRHKVSAESFAGTTVGVEIIADPTSTPLYFA
ncbi:MAG: hypothetical protein JWN70_4319 [Planctomycetaceae bacterium]|nr:hypothetical protein [Planctomycetaceae bacterium]